MRMWVGGIGWLMRWGISFIAISLIFFGCNVKEKGGKERVSLTYIIFGDAEFFRYMQGIVEEFEKKHPSLKIKVEPIPGDYYTKLQTLIAGGVPPDLILMTHERHPIYVEKGTFLDLTPYVQDKDFQERIKDIYPQVWESDKYKKDGKIYFLTIWQNPVVVYYNKTLFDEAGISSPNEGWDWEDFLKACKQLTKDTKNGRQFGTTSIGVSFFSLAPFLWQNKAEILNESQSKCLLDTKEAIEAIQWCFDLKNKYYVAPTPAQQSDRSDDQLFMSGKVAMTRSGRWSGYVYKNIKSFEWDVAPLPKGKAEATYNTTAILAISSKCRYPNEAWKFLKYMVSPEVQTKIAQYGHDVPILKSVADSRYFLTPEVPPQSDWVFLDSISYSRFLPAHPHFEELEKSIIVPVLEQAYYGQKSVREACRLAASKGNSFLQEYSPED